MKKLSRREDWEIKEKMKGNEDDDGDDREMEVKVKDIHALLK